MGKLDKATFLEGHAKDQLQNLEEGSVQTCITSPPYWGLRDYSEEDQIGLEPTPEKYVANLVEVFSEVKRVLREDGTFWLNIGDTYAQNEIRHRDGTSESRSRPNLAENLNMTGKKMEHGVKEKDLIGVPWRLAFALQDDDWHLRNHIIWKKTNPMPESVKDRFTTSHESIFLLSKNKHYKFNQIKEPHKTAPNYEGGETRGHTTKDGKKWAGQQEQRHGSNINYSEGGKNKRDVWEMSVASFQDGHFAVFPEQLPKNCIKAGSDEGDVVLDPFSGAATTGVAALKLGRKYIGVDLNSDYHEIAKKRIREDDEVPANHDFW
jgi:site-specific DNA-methyltransferase (cytosine-N4-specific)